MVTIALAILGVWIAMLAILVVILEVASRLYHRNAKRRLESQYLSLEHLWELPERTPTHEKRR